MANKTKEKKEKPRVFIGSSSESIKIANYINVLLEHDTEPTVWHQGIFTPSNTSLDDLVENLETFDFAVFVFSPDDVSKIRDKEYLVARDNVIFEMGLFIGRLGKKRVFYIIPRYIEADFHLPSDLIGVTPLDYNNQRADGRIQAALGSPSTKIIERTNKLGRFESSSSKTEYKSVAEESIFSSQEDKEFQRIYEKLKPSRNATMRVYKRHPEQSYKSITVGKCIFKYSLINVVWTNICEGNNTFNYFLITLSEKARGIADSQLNSSEKDKLLFGDLVSENNLIPLLSILGLLDEQLDNDPRQMVPNFAFHIYSKKMYRFYDWFDYNNLQSNEPPLEFVEFVESKE